MGDNKYWRITMYGAGRATYHLPASKFKTEEEARAYMEKHNGDPTYKIYEQVEDNYIEFVEQCIYPS